LLGKTQNKIGSGYFASRGIIASRPILPSSSLSITI